MRRLPDPAFHGMLLLLLAFSVLAIRVDGYARKRCVYHDEGVSYLCAAAKQGFFDNWRHSPQHPSNRWARTDEWREFYTIDEPFDYGTIRKDLIVSDVHPPFYFWTLHTFSYLAGIDARTGPQLNTLLHVLTFLVFFLLLRCLTRDRLTIAAALALWTFSPSVIGVTFVARQYELSTLLFLASLLLFVKLLTAEARAPLLYAGLSLTLFLGMLSHYQFVYVYGIVLTLALVSFLSGWISRRRFFGVAGTALLSFGSFLAAQPEFFGHIKKYDQWNQSYSYPELLERLDMSTIEIFHFFGSDLGLGFVSVTLLLITLSLLAYVTVRARRDGDRERFLIMLAFWMIAAVIFVQYWSFLSPWHAMEDRYLALVWPLWSLMLVFLVASIPWQRVRHAALSAILVAILVVGYAQHDEVHYLCDGSAPYLDLLPDYDTYLMDAPHRGRMPQVLVNLEDGKEIFVATQFELLWKPEPWMEHLATKESALYLSMLGYENTRDQREMILHLLGRIFEVQEVEGGRFAAFALTTRSSAAAGSPSDSEARSQP